MSSSNVLVATNGASSSTGDGDQCRSTPIHANRDMRVACIGAGASGLHLIYKMKRNFTNFTLDVYEKNADVAGTWYENTYPGCACDVPAHNYVYSFEPNPSLPANYSSRADIFAYFSGFADKYGLRKYVHTQHEVVGATWDEDRACWVVSVRGPDGAAFDKDYDFLISATGFLNAWKWPAIPGIENYKGKLVHSAAWDNSLDVAGNHVGLIGNGSTGVQLLPEMQKNAAHVTAFIRSVNWISPTPGMGLREYTQEERDEFVLRPEKLTKLRKETEVVMSQVFTTIHRNSEANTQAQTYIHQKMVEKLGDEELARKLIPNSTFGCKRIIPGLDYLECFKQPNVTPVFGGVKEITERGCVTADGKEHPVDVIICATGFDTSFRPRFPIRGRNGANLAEEWSREPRGYLGVAASGYPNYFMHMGPNSPIANGSLTAAIEMQTEYILRFMNRWQKEDIRSFDVRREAVDDFIHQKDLFMRRTVWTEDCTSWYKNPADGRITAIWPGSTLHYMETLATPRFDDYEVAYNGRRFAYLGGGFSQTELNPGLDKTYYIRDRGDGSSMFRSLMSDFNVRDEIDLTSGGSGLFSGGK